jgi:hypothetical protein
VFLNTDLLKGDIMSQRPDNNNMKNDMNKKQGESVAHKAGDAIERVGEKITQAGAGKIGRLVSDAGDKLEHAGEDRDQKDSKH